jgi:hypothetical protein
LAQVEAVAMNELVKTLDVVTLEGWSNINILNHEKHIPSDH